MCSIICGFKKEKIIELIKLNQYRGNFSYSISVFDPFRGLLYGFKDFGKFNFDKLPETLDEAYYICHVQAPTGGLIKDKSRIHPSTINNSYLWHNGILKNEYINKLQKEYKTNSEWDTLLLHEHIYKKGFNILNEVDGSFGCIYYDPLIVGDNEFTIYVNLFMFTSDIVNLYIDDELSISSVNFINSKRVPPNKVFKIDILNKKLELINNFISKCSPYYFIEDESV